MLGNGLKTIHFLSEPEERALNRAPGFAPFTSSDPRRDSVRAQGRGGRVYSARSPDLHLCLYLQPYYFRPGGVPWGASHNLSESQLPRQQNEANITHPPHRVVGQSNDSHRNTLGLVPVPISQR